MNKNQKKLHKSTMKRRARIALILNYKIIERFNPINNMSKQLSNNYLIILRESNLSIRTLNVIS